jgi:conjugative relaxase-like TrwC/TraI family protein
MLTIGKLGIGQERYYLDKVAEGAEDYYSGEGEVAGEWLGDAAEDLGLSGEVEAAQLEAMLTGRNPVDGEPLLSMNGVPAKGGVPGFDLTFSAPKSISLLWGLGGPVAAAEVSAAHREAVHAALDYMQREACWTRRGAGGSEFVNGNGYLAAGYVHRSSRNGDPQLHTHVLIANATKGPDGRWSRSQASTAGGDVATNPRGTASPWPRTARGASAPARQGTEHRSVTSADLPTIEAPHRAAVNPLRGSGASALDAMKERAS